MDERLQPVVPLHRTERTRRPAQWAPFRIEIRSRPPDRYLRGDQGSAPHAYSNNSRTLTTVTGIPV
jgi:hypothetical protein